MKRIAVYCGASSGNSPIYTDGGVGTLEEIAQAFSWARLGNYEGPCIFYNVAGYYDPLATMFDDMAAKGFLSQEDRNKILFSDSLETIHSFMANYVPPKIRGYQQPQ